MRVYYYISDRSFNSRIMGSKLGQYKQTFSVLIRSVTCTNMNEKLMVIMIIKLFTTASANGVSEKCLLVAFINKS